MGVLIYRGTVGSTSKDPKIKSILIASIAKFLEILSTSAKLSIDMELKPPIKVRITRPSGAVEKKEVNHIDDELFQELVASKAFEIEAEVKPDSWVGFKYDESKHYGQNIDYEIAVGFKEPLDWDAPGFKGFLHRIVGKTMMQVGQSKMNRLFELFDKVFSRYLGTTMTRSLEKIKVRKHEPEAIYINIFGNIIKVKE